MSNGNNDQLLFDKMNYMLLGGGVLLILLGFVLMSGGGSDDPNVFNPEIFNFQRITLAPFTVLLGFGLVGYGILRKPKDAQDDASKGEIQK